MDKWNSSMWSETRFENALASFLVIFEASKTGRGRLGILRQQTSYQQSKQFLNEGGCHQKYLVHASHTTVNKRLMQLNCLHLDFCYKLNKLGPFFRQ